MIKRRKFITLLGGAVARPLAAYGQRRTRRIGVLTLFGINDSEGQARVAVFRSKLAELGWIEGQNIHIDYRWAEDPLSQVRTYASELVEQMPDAILASSTAPVAALMKANSTIPIVFGQVSCSRLVLTTLFLRQLKQLGCGFSTLLRVV